MRLLLICVGRLKSGPERELFERYFDRLNAMARSVGVSAADLREIQESGARRAEDRRDEEAIAILKAVGPRDTLVALDERGLSPTSADWAANLARTRDEGGSAYVVVIGGPDGLSNAIRERAQKVFSFGSMTWPHQLVRIMAAEQLYRALTILSGHPYHRA